MANAWYRTGKVAVTNGSASVVGIGTSWLGAGSPPTINAGDIFFAPDGNQYEIVTVPTNTSMTIKQKDGTAAYLGATSVTPLVGDSYSIIKTGPNNATVATQLTTLAVGWQQDRDQYANWLGGTATGGDGSGNYPLTDANNVTRNVACPAKLAVSFSPLGGPGSGVAFSVGALTAATLQFGSGSTTSAGIYGAYFGTSGYAGLWSTAVTPTGSNVGLILSADASYLNGAVVSALRVGNANIAVASPTGLAVTGSISASGNSVHNVASAPALTTSFDFGVEMVSNTSIRLKMRGADGVTRSATLTVT